MRLSMAKPIICFDRVSKRFALRRDRPRSFRELFVRGAARLARQRADTLWALRDVSFDIRPAETVALIGPNGAGKSTALKLISRVIFPTTGALQVQGRVGALLELGAGFHPDLTGRDNVLLASALAGVSRAEALRKLPAIVDFAELERFMDVPVKHYSSGMYARLAFSVSIHIDPEILLVDEVLAVGDQAFQQKCLDRIATLKRAGVSLCFVSHSLETARAVCTRGLWIEHGHLRADGPIDQVAEAYLDWVVNQRPSDGPGAVESDQRHGSRKVEVTRVALLDGLGAERQMFHTGQPLRVAIEYRVNDPVPDAVVGLAVHRLDGVHVTGPNTSATPLRLPAASGHGVVTYTVPALPLLDGHYQLSVAIHNRADTEFYDYFDRAFGFQVSNSQGEFPERYGLMTLGGEWHHQSA